MTQAVAQLERVAAEVPSVKVVPNPQQPPPQPDRPYVLTLQTDFNSGSSDLAKQLRKKVGIDGDQPGQAQDGRVKLYVIGQGALGAAASEATKHDIAQAEKWNLPIVMIVLLAVFGSLAAAAMPLVLGICTVVVTMGLVYLLSMVTQMSVFVTSTVSMFGIALAVDYSLFILMRFREELRSGRDPAQAADAAMATSGLAVLLSGLTVIASVTGIYLIHTPVLASMATGAILAVAVAVLTSTTLIPAVLATVGKAASKRSSWLHVSRRPETTQSRFWTRWVGWVMRRQWISALGATLVLVVLATPAFAMTLGNSPAAPVRAHPRDPRRDQCRVAGAGPWRARPHPRPGHLPRRERQRVGEHRRTGRDPAEDGPGTRRRDGVTAGVRQRQPQRPTVGGAVDRPGGPRRPATPWTGCAPNCPAPHQVPLPSSMSADPPRCSRTSIDAWR